MSLSDNLDYCEAPSPGLGLTGAGLHLSCIVIDHLAFRYTRYERLSPILCTQNCNSPSHPQSRIYFPGHVSQKHAAVHELVHHGIGTGSQQSYDRDGDDEASESKLPAPVAIGDARTQGLRVWNRSGLYCVRGGPPRPAPLCLRFYTMPRRQVIQFSREKGHEINLRYKGNSANPVGPSLP